MSEVKDSQTLLISILSLPSTVGKAGVCLLSLPPSPWGWAPTSVLYCTGPLLPGIRSQLLGSPPGSDVGHSRSDWPGHSSTEQFHLHISVPCLQRKTIFTAQLVYSHTHHNMTTSPETSLKGTAMCLFTHVRVVFISLGKWYNVSLKKHFITSIYVKGSEHTTAHEWRSEDNCGSWFCPIKWVLRPELKLSALVASLPEPLNLCSESLKSEAKRS